MVVAINVDAEEPEKMCFSEYGAIFS